MNSAEIGSFLAALWRSSLEAGVVVGLVLAAQWLFRARLTPRWRSALWLLVVARLLLPFSLSSTVSIFNLVPRPRPHLSIMPPASPIVATPPAPAPHADNTRPWPLPKYTEPPSRGWAWQYWVLAVWLAGAAVLARHVLWSSIRFWKLYERLQPCTAPVVLTVFAECCQRFGVQRPPSILESSAMSSPALHGIFRPRLLLPRGLGERFSPAEMRFIFLHELAHLQRRDLPVNWLMAVLQVAHWFNPLVWLGFARWRADRELACDALALEIAGPDQNREYGRTVLRLLEMMSHPLSTPGLVGILEDKRQLRRRIDMIASYMPAPGWPRLALLLMAALAVVGLTDARSAPESEPAGTQKSVAEQLIGTWVLVGEPGEVEKAPSSGGRYKFFTGSRWCITQAGSKNGIVIFHHGGTYKIDGDQYTESVEYANPTTMDRIGSKGRYKMTIDGDTLTQIGEDNKLKEVWQRVRSKVGSADLPLDQQLVGAWVLVESGGKSADKPDEQTGYKFITPSGWCVTQADPDNHVVVIHHGGSYTLKGNRYVEHVVYANPVSMNLIGHTFNFDLQLDGDTLHSTGIDNPWKEVWKRVK